MNTTEKTHIHIYIYIYIYPCLLTEEDREITICVNKYENWKAAALIIALYLYLYLYIHPCSSVLLNSVPGVVLEGSPVVFLIQKSESPSSGIRPLHPASDSGVSAQLLQLEAQSHL